MKKLAISAIAATLMATMVSLPRLHAQDAAAPPINPQGVLKPEPFADVPPDHWAYNAVEFLRRQGLIDGFPDQTFKGKRPMTRYEIAQMTFRMLQGVMRRVEALEAKPETRDPGSVDTSGLVTQDQLNQRLQQLQNTQLTREQVRQMIEEEVARQKPDLSNYVTKDQLATLQRLVDEFRNELQRLNVDVDAVKKDLADVRTRLEAVEADLARMTRIVGNANLIGKGDMKSSQIFNAATGTFRPAFDRDGRPLNDDTNIFTPVLGYYDLDLGIVARPTSDVRAAAVLNVGNYATSYGAPNLHGYAGEGAAAVTPYKAFINVPFRLFGDDVQELTVGLQATQLTPFTFKSVDPDTYTFVPREDSGEVIFWGAQTTWRFGGAKVRAFAGTDPQDGRLQPVNQYVDATGAGAIGLGSVFGSGIARLDAAGAARATGPIQQLGNFAGARLTWGEPDVVPYRAEELPVGSAEQLGVKPTTPMGDRDVTAAAPAEPAMEGEEPEVGVSFGPLRNLVFGVNWLYGAGTQARTVEDARAWLVGGDANFKVGPIRLEGEAAFAQSQVGAGVLRPRALDDWAFDVRGFWDLSLGSFADLQLGGGYRSIESGYLVPGYWGTLGTWKNPRGIEGPLAQIRIPLHRSFIVNNIAFIASGEWYQGADDIPTLAAPGTIVGTTTDPNESDLRIDRYLVGLQFGLTSRNTVDLGFEQVFRNFVSRSGDRPLFLPTGGVAGSQLIGSRIKNTETYLNFGIGHNFTPDVAAKALVQLVDFQKYAEDDSNQPANYRGWVATAQVGVRF